MCEDKRICDTQFNQFRISIRYLAQLRRVDMQ